MGIVCLLMMLITLQLELAYQLLFWFWLHCLPLAQPSSSQPSIVESIALQQIPKSSCLLALSCFRRPQR
jgi:hypothetical protein